MSVVTSVESELRITKEDLNPKITSNCIQDFPKTKTIEIGSQSITESFHYE